MARTHGLGHYGGAPAIQLPDAALCLSAEREELGGVEYKAVSVLSWIVSLYFFLFLLLGIIGVGTWLQANHPEVTRVNGLDPFWTGAFFAVSAFVNSGMSLLDKNMTALQLK